MQSLSNLKRGKAPGPDALPSALLKAGGVTLARQFTTLLTKIMATATEPLPWKGGRAAPLWKGKASPHLPDSYRSIFISNFLTKIFHQCLRRHLVRAWLRTSSSFQCGGRPSIGADQAHHLLQTHSHWCMHHRLPHAIVFFDFKAAFYSVLRQGLTSFPIDSASLLRHTLSQGASVSDMRRLVEALHVDAASLGLDAHVDRMLADVLSNTFFTVEGLDSPCATSRGTRPGDPVGDVLFNITMAAILAEFRAELEAELQLPWLTSPGPCADYTTWSSPPDTGVGDVSFVDDCAVLLHGCDNEMVQGLISTVVSTFVRLAAKRGLTVNFEPGKSEVLWTPVGKGARRARQQLALSNHLLVWDSSSQASVRVVDSYRHLGTWLQASNLHAREVLARGSAAKQSWGPLARTFYGKAAISQATKARVFHALSISRFVYNAHVWSGVTSKELDRWTVQLRPPLLQILRSQLRGLPGFKFDTETLASLLGVLPPQALLHLSRLRYLQRLLRHCPPMLWNWLQDLLSNDCGWLSDCRASLRWFALHYPTRLVPAADAPLDVWLTWVSLDSSWKGRLRTAAANCLRYHQRNAEYMLWQARFASLLQHAGAILPSEVPAPPEPLWQCDFCTAQFATRRALATHAYKQHGYRAEVRYYAEGGLCNACGLQLHDRPRLQRHLQGSDACFATLRATAPPLSEEYVDELDRQCQDQARVRQKQGWLPTRALSAALTVQGPLLPPALSIEAQQMPRPGTRFCNYGGHALVQGVPDAHRLWWRSQDLPAFVMQSSGGPQTGGGAFCNVGLAREAARLHVHALTFVHFFSGYRRDGDLHHIMEQRVLASGLQLFVISVDICLQRQDANLASGHSLTWWRTQIRKGLIFGAGGGPPCETWTAARHLPGGPPPLRGAKHFWGLPDLSPRHSDQVLVGTRLLTFLWMLLADLALCGGCGFCEHPQYPLWARHL
eukprot:Skav208866  [mRNA]  locus=scaffold6901:57030:59888:+ [translate_table: standard]